MAASGEQLRTLLRELIAETIPADFLGAFTDDPKDLAIAQAFCHRLAADGLLTLSWPKEYGGQGQSVWDQTIVREEMWAHHEPRGAQYMGVNWVGPAIAEYGTDAQRAEHLPKIAAGNVIWCQGFSEPEAGSDLASLRTTATPDGAQFRISGQKIWTSYAQMAQWCVLAARLPETSRQRGITLFLVPMDSEGITVRPIRSMLGPHHLNECFFDDVRVEQVLGTVGEGWDVIKRALSYERVGIARYARCDRLLSLLPQALGPAWDDVSEAVRAQWVRRLSQVRTARLLAYRAVAAQAKGEPFDALASAARLATTQCDQDVAEFLMRVLGAAGLMDRSGADDPPAHGAFEDHWRYAQAATVASGTSEVQRIVVSRAELTKA